MQKNNCCGKNVVVNVNTCGCCNPDTSNGGVPVGTVISFIGLMAPEGYLIMDGTTYNIADYKNLAEHFKNQFGSDNYFGGDGVANFAVPDCRGEFLRGYDPTKLQDPEGDNRGIGKHQDATQIPNLQASGIGSLFIANYIPNGDVVCTEVDKYIDKIGSDKQGRSSVGLENTFVSSYTTHYTTRPTNINVLYCIKY